MPRTSTIDRLSRLDLLSSRLKAEEPMTVDAIATEFGVSRRTLFRDVAILRDRGLPIEADRGRGGGIRLHRTWGIGRLTLSYREAVELLVSLAIAERMEAPWLIASLAPIRRKLAASFSPALKERIEGLAQRIRVGGVASARVLEGFARPDPAAAEALCQAFLELRVLDFAYTDTEGRQSRRRVEPQYLMLNYPVWYLVGHDLGRQAVRSFRLDRIGTARIEGQTFRLRPASGFADAFAGIPALSR